VLTVAEAVLEGTGRVVEVRDEPELARYVVGARLRFRVPRPESGASG
jgi:hypothetical protein